MLARGIALAVLLLAMPPAVPVHAQTVRLSVVDGASLGPVVGASVALLHQGRTIATGESDSEGRLVLEADDPGIFSLTVRGLGYSDFTSEPLAVGRDQFVEVRVTMGMDAIPLEPLVVVATGRTLSPGMLGFERRRADPSLGGSYLTREDIDRRPIATPTELLYALPGVRLHPIMTPNSPYAQERNLIWFSSDRGETPVPGACLADVYLNGVPARQSADSSMDDLLEGASLAGVEVYPRPLSAPVEYSGRGNCGVVLFWTDPAESEGATWSWKRIALGGALIGLLATIAIVN